MKETHYPLVQHTCTWIMFLPVPIYSRIMLYQNSAFVSLSIPLVRFLCLFPLKLIPIFPHIRPKTLPSPLCF